MGCAAPLAIATILDGPRIGERAFAGLSALDEAASKTDIRLGKLAERSVRGRVCRSTSGLNWTVQRHASWIDYRAARPGLWIFGAGDDAKPLLKLARELGWFVAIADGRSHLTTQSRFAAADEVRVLNIGDLPRRCGNSLPLLPTDAAVLMTHSFEQDSHILAELMDQARGFPYAYVGVLGPQRRTREVLAEAARCVASRRMRNASESWLGQLHAPTGIDLGADTSASIALSILSEMQQIANAATGLPLRQVRATNPPVGPPQQLRRLALGLIRPSRAPSCALPPLPGISPAMRDAPATRDR